MTASTDKSSLVLLSFPLGQYESSPDPNTGIKFKQENELLFGTNLLESTSIVRYENTVLLFVSACDYKVHIYQIYQVAEANSGDGKNFIGTWQFNF